MYFQILSLFFSILPVTTFNRTRGVVSVESLHIKFSVVQSVSDEGEVRPTAGRHRENVTTHWHL